MINQTFIIFDLETTGLDYTKGDRITEIGAIKVKNNQISKETFQTLVNPHRPISPECIKICGITDEMVKDAPNIIEVMTKFIEFVEDGILVAHNAQFDMSFTRPEWEHASPFIEYPTTICTKELDKVFYPEDKFHNLDIVCTRWEVSAPTDRHRALSDATSTAECFTKMISNKLKIPDLNTLLNKSAVYRDYRHR